MQNWLVCSICYGSGVPTWCALRVVTSTTNWTDPVPSATPTGTSFTANSARGTFRDPQSCSTTPRTEPTNSRWWGIVHKCDQTFLLREMVRHHTRLNWDWYQDQQVSRYRFRTILACVILPKTLVISLNTTLALASFEGRVVQQRHAIRPGLELLDWWWFSRRPYWHDGVRKRLS